MGAVVPKTNKTSMYSGTNRLQVSHCSTFRINMCDVRRVAVFCSESIECFPGVSSKFYSKNRKQYEYCEQL